MVILVPERLSPERRSANMSRIRSNRTKPEMAVRKTIHSLGYRYRLHVKQLPGKPDLVFPSRRKVVFVNGCFWHQHPGCREGRVPGSNAAYWVPKLERNVLRDRQSYEKLRAEGWDVLVLWECDVERGAFVAGLVEFLGPR